MDNYAIADSYTVETPAKRQLFQIERDIRYCVSELRALHVRTIAARKLYCYDGTEEIVGKIRAEQNEKTELLRNLAKERGRYFPAQDIAEFICNVLIGF